MNNVLNNLSYGMYVLIANGLFMKINDERK